MASSSNLPITVVGAGLAGTLEAVLLAQRGESVRLVERRPDMRELELAAGRSINLALSTRGITALERVGLAEEVLARSIPMRGRRMHAVDGTETFQPYGLEGQAIRSVSRRELNETLLDAAEAAGIEMLFEHRCVGVEGIDSTTSDMVIAHFERADGSTVPLSSRFLIGADGAYSSVRLAMQMTVGFDYSQSYVPYGYKELTMPPTRDGDFALEPHALHIWPRHQYMLIALPNLDRSFTCTLFLPFEPVDANGPAEEGGAEDDTGELSRIPSFAEIETADDVVALFERDFPDARPHFPELTDEFLTNPTGAMVTIRCDPYHRGRSLLIGDAAHAVVPFYGQGMNAAFEDTRILDDLYEELDGDWPAIMQRFSDSRPGDANAIADLALHNFVVMRDNVADARFLERKKLERELHRRIPEVYVPLYSMISFSNLPYAEARERSALQDQLLEEVLPGVMAGELDIETVAARFEQELQAFEASLEGRHGPDAIPS